MNAVSMENRSDPEAPTWSQFASVRTRQLTSDDDEDTDSDDDQDGFEWPENEDIDARHGPSLIDIPIVELCAVPCLLEAR